MARQYNEGWVVEELSAIPDKSRADLIKRWETAHGSAPPKGINRRLLEYSAAYQIQIKAFGGLKPALRRKLRVYVQSKDKPSASAAVPRKSNLLSPGTRLVRDWHGATHTVEVTDSGFLHDGEVFKSLSKIAYVITGVRWSGPRFFGL
jgi:hypothetical protein